MLYKNYKVEGVCIILASIALQKSKQKALIDSFIDLKHNSMLQFIRSICTKVGITAFYI